MERVVGGPAGSRLQLGHKGSAWGHTPHQLVHGPETGEATGSCSLAEVFLFFFLTYAIDSSGPGGKLTSLSWLVFQHDSLQILALFGARPIRLS